MTGLGDLLELLHGAPGPHRSVRGVLRHRTHLRLAEEAERRWQEQLRAAGRSAGRAYATMFAVGPPVEPPTHHELTVRFWSEPPARLREEVETLGPEPHLHVSVRDGDRWWTYAPEWGAVSNAGAAGADEDVHVGGGAHWPALLEPARWIPLLDFDVSGEADVLGRRALRVRGTGRPAAGDVFGPHELPLGADRYELVVDRERGVVLALTAFVGGEELSASAFDELAFDEPFPAGTFTFEPPPGEPLRAPDEHLHEAVTIEEAARRASFPVLVVPELPDGRWATHVSYVEPRARPPLQEAVTIFYHRSDALHTLVLTERPAGEQTPDGPAHGAQGLDAERVERGGSTVTVYRPERRGGMPITVAVTREGTAVELSSPDLDEETLVGLAASLVPLR